MQTSTPEYLAAAIADMRQTEHHLAAKLTPLREGVARIEAEMREHKHDLDVADKGLQTAADALATSTVARALDETSEAAHRLCIDAVAAAQKIVSKVAPKAGEVTRLADAARKLAQRIAPLETHVIDLRAELAAATLEAKYVAVETGMHASIAAYTSAAGVVMDALGKAFAAHRFLESRGRDPKLMTSSIHGSALGTWAGSPHTGSFADAAEAERLRLVSAFGSR
jgi:hypothetical protein